ncbi:870_t:CDS:2 [Funneliformis caledonium]|uniref:870_t:CDS:1 n=1 Tax=Funneliformis caledonium TaxID=1117310 RepID=A0A9N9GRT8_9GLOM|nr:870_t:CDS:2 [Funneliformis caledonium]
MSSPVVSALKRVVFLTKNVDHFYRLYIRYLANKATDSGPLEFHYMLSELSSKKIHFSKIHVTFPIITNSRCGQSETLNL